MLRPLDLPLEQLVALHLAQHAHRGGSAISAAQAATTAMTAATVTASS
jgi:hypothetical protein